MNDGNGRCWKRRKLSHSNQSQQSDMKSSHRAGVRKKRKSKKMTIKKFKVSPKLSSSYEKETVDKLMAAIRDIHLKRGGSCSFESLYRFCQSLCTLNRGKLIYDKLYLLCDDHIGAQVDALCMDEQRVLYGLQSIWNSFKAEMHAIRQVFLMLDRTYVRQQTEMKSLWKMGIALLRKHVLERPQNAWICREMISKLLALIDSERNGEEIDSVLVKTVMVMMAHLNVYRSQFEPALTRSTSSYYNKLGSKLVSERAVPDYLDAVMKRLDDEHSRCVLYLDNKTQRYLSMAIEQEMVSKHHGYILEKGLDSMCDAVLVDDLRHLYGLFQSVHKLPALKEHFSVYARKRGLAVVNDQENDKEMVSKLLSFKKRLDDIISSSFQRDPDFRGIIRSSWEYFLNQRQNKPAELMAKVFIIFKSR